MKKNLQRYSYSVHLLRSDLQFKFLLNDINEVVLKTYKKVEITFSTSQDTFTKTG